MSVLDDLLRLRRRQCEERRRYLAELQRLAERLRAAALRLQGEIAEAGSGGDPGFARALVDRHGRLRRSLAEIESRLAAAGEALAAAERELQRLDFASAHRTGGASRRPRQTPSPGTRRRG